MQDLPFQATKELEGWTLFWAELERTRVGEDVLPALLRDVAQSIRDAVELKHLSSQPTVAALRRLFRVAGCDPTRYRPSSEALLRRILKGNEIPLIHPFVDINNCMSARLAVPCCVMADETFRPPLVFRSGTAGESYESLRGPFNLEGKPLLCDALGPLDAPITGSQRVKVVGETTRVSLVSYLPEETVSLHEAEQTLIGLLKIAPVAEITFTSGF